MNLYDTIIALIAANPKTTFCGISFSVMLALIVHAWNRLIIRDLLNVQKENVKTIDKQEAEREGWKNDRRRESNDSILAYQKFIRELVLIYGEPVVLNGAQFKRIEFTVPSGHLAQDVNGSLIEHSRHPDKETNTTRHVVRSFVSAGKPVTATAQPTIPGSGSPDGERAPWVDNQGEQL